MSQKKKILLLSLGALLVLIIVFLIIEGTEHSGKTYRVKRGNLEAVVNCIGEIQGEKATNIELAPVLCDRDLRVWSYKVVDLIAEGKSVKKGDYVARLDETMIMNPMRERMDQKEKQDADLKNARIDSTVTLTQKREAITNAKLDLEYKRIDLEQSKYESGAQQRKAQMAFQKSEIELKKAERDYLLERNRQKIKVSRYESNVEYQDRLIKKYQEALRSTTIKSPSDGIIMFAKDWMGKKLTKDSEVGIWDPRVATLPDMSSVVSEAYIKEIDIAKVKKGDSVRISVDALPDKTFFGTIYHIATIGEEHKNFDMKVFRVMIRLKETDEKLKPGMTCNNDIIISNNENVLLIPLNAVFSDDRQPYVFLRKGNTAVRHNIKTGDEDASNIVVTDGLKEGDEVLLYNPETQGS